jgi:hypothetical protein
LGEAALCHHDAFQRLSARLESLAARLDAARSCYGQQRPDLFDGVMEALGGLTAAVAGVRAVWERDDPRLDPRLARPRPAAAPPLRPPATLPPTGDDADSPWDRQAAEALMRVYELAAREERSTPSPRPARGRPARPPQAAPGHAAEARLLALADGLEAALARLDPTQWLGPLDQRVRELQATALTAAPPLPDRQGLGGVETLIGDLSRRLDATRSGELARLDAIDARLEQMLALGERAQTAAEAAAVSAARHSPGNVGLASERHVAETCEGLLKACASARRQDARTALGVLKSIHDALAGLSDRLDVGQADALPREAGAMAGNDPHADHDLLLKAYQEGARALGQTVTETTSEPVAPIPRRMRADWSASTWRWHAGD